MRPQDGPYKYAIPTLIALYRALGRGRELRFGDDFVTEEMKDEMRRRNNRGRLLDTETLSKDIDSCRIQRRRGQGMVALEMVTAKVVAGRLREVSMRKQRFRLTVGLLCASVALAACKAGPEIVEAVRAVKTITVQERAAEQTLKFSGIVAAVDSSGLSFQVAGQVESVEVDIGDRVKKGQVLAVLDPEPYQLQVGEITAELAKTRDNVTKTKAEYERQKKLFEQGAGAERYVEISEYDYNASLSGVDVQIAKLDRSKRDLRKTKLPAPYDGVIAWRLVQPNEEVRVGQKVLEINATGKMEVELAIPETTVDRIRIDEPTTITFPTLPGEFIKGRISYIGGAAVKANAFPVKVELIAPNKEIKPGMTAEAILTVKDENREPGYLIPMQALLPSQEPNQGYVFLYDAQTSTVKKTSVRFRGTKNKKLIVDEGLAAGDTIAIAGVTFLADGMEVHLME